VNLVTSLITSKAENLLRNLKLQINTLHLLQMLCVFCLSSLQERYLESLPLFLFGGMSILSGLLSLTFPETLNSKLPDTVKDAENINKNSRTR